MQSILYKPHIDGLRALAVLLVILHHLGDWIGVTGGYIGVDVFFVISGFLITSIVKAEIENGAFSLRNFYKRRVVRLAPAYFTVLVATSAASMLWMLPAELVEYARSVAASSLFLANFYMWKEVGGYFGTAANTTPLLHLWSLAVEEQFYLLWPITLLIVYRWIGSRKVLPILLVLTACGILFSQWGVIRFPSAGYYLLPTRFYELTLGAGLAYLPVATGGKAARAVASSLGLAMITYAALTYSTQTYFPGYAGLMPAIGSALLVRWGGSGTPIGALLSAPIMTMLGRISYPAYLWHWPIIAFMRINGVQITVPLGITVIFSTFVLAWLTYRGIELKARSLLTFSPRWVIVIGACVPITVSVFFASLVLSKNGFPERFPDSLNAKSAALLAYSNKARGRCNEGPPTVPLSADDCVLGRPGGNVDFLLVGDSHANHFSGFMDELGKAAGLRGYDMTRSQTAFLPGVDLWTPRAGKADHHENFVPRNAYITDLLKREHFAYIVLAANWSYYFQAGSMLRSDALEGEEAFKVGMRAAIREAQAASRKVVIIDSVPSLTSGLHDCGLRNERFRLLHDCTLQLDRHVAHTAGVGAFFDELRRTFPDVVWVQPAKIMCSNEGRCATELDGIPLYRDSGHLNDHGARLLAAKWMERFGNPLQW
jgi:peptidoglycan/LPS O-acetylase OafA/YrhL